MALTLANIRRTAKSRYGLDYTTAEDPVFTDAFMLEIINQAYWWFAAETLCFYERSLEFNVTNGTAEYALDATLIKIDPRTVYLLHYTSAPAAQYTRLAYREYGDLVEFYGAPIDDTVTVAAGTPSYFILHPGKASGSEKKMTLVPSPSGLRGSDGSTSTNDKKVRYAGFVYPAELTSDSDNIALAEPDAYRMVPAICWHMALFERGKGRASSSDEIAKWEQMAKEEAAVVKQLMLETTSAPDRGALSAVYPAMESEERRSPRFSR